MAKRQPRLRSKKSIEEFSDRELLLFILSNQIKLYRQTQYLMQFAENSKAESLGQFHITFEKLLRDSDIVLKQIEEFLGNEIEESSSI